MTRKTVFCMVTSFKQAEFIVERLKNSGFSSNDISVLFHDRIGRCELSDEADANLPQVSDDGALESLPKISAISISGIGQFVAAGPIMGVLKHSSVNGISDGLVEMGLPGVDARRCEKRIYKGSILVSVLTDNELELAGTQSLFAQAGAQFIIAGYDHVVNRNPAHMKAGVLVPA